MCPCDADIMITEYTLQCCQLHDALSLRQDMWPEQTPNMDMIFGDLEELRKAAAYLWAVDISIYLLYHEEMKKKCFIYT